MQSKRSFIREFINDNCIFRCPPGYFIKAVTPGHAYSWQFYLRKAIFHGLAGPMIAEWLLEESQNDAGVQYAGMESAGPPLLSMLMSAAYLKHDDLINGFSIRKDQKKYGLFNWIEGAPSTAPVVLLDDIANSKSTLLRAKEICEAHGLTVIGARTIVNKDSTKNELGCPIDSMFDLNEFDLSWNNYYADRMEPNIDEWVKTYADLLLKETSPNVLSAVSNPDLLSGFPNL